MVLRRVGGLTSYMKKSNKKNFEDKCEACDGTGKCSRCDGTGEDRHGLFGLGLINDYCKKCSGTGDCRFCDETGKID